MSSKKISLTLKGAPVTAEEIKKELNLAAEELLDTAAKELEIRIGRLIENLNHRSTMRGRGRYASDYNRPFEGVETKVKVTRQGKKFIIFVDDYKFNLLEDGQKARTHDNYTRFPAYDGTLTKENSSRLNRSKVKVGDEPAWITIRAGRQIGAVKPRNFYEDLVKRFTFTELRRILGKSIFKFPLDPRYIEVEIIKNGS